MNKIEFIKAVLYKNINAFLVYVRSLELRMTIYLAKKTQIALMLTKKVIILVKYLDFANVFLKKLIKVLLEQIRANKHAIKLEKGKQLAYESIHSLSLVEIEIFKPCIKTNLAIDFFKAPKLSADTLFFFICKANGSLCLCVNYSKLNNFIIHNWYLLPLIGESVNWLDKLINLTSLVSQVLTIIWRLKKAINER